MFLVLTASLLLSGSVSSQPIRAVDFRNHAYSLTRFQRERPDTITLVDGQARFADDPDVAPGVSLRSVKYGDLDLDGQEEALVVLRYGNAGSALHYDYLFVFRMGPEGPIVWYSDQYEAATAIVLSGSAVVVKAPFWLSSDAHCCPTYNARYTIRPSAGRLRVVSKHLYRMTKST